MVLPAIKATASVPCVDATPVSSYKELGFTVEEIQGSGWSRSARIFGAPIQNV